MLTIHSVYWQTSWAHLFLCYFCTFVLDLTFSSSTKNPDWVIASCVCLHAYISPTKCLNEPNFSSLLIYFWDKDNKWAKMKRQCSDKREKSDSEIWIDFLQISFFSPVLDLPNSNCSVDSLGGCLDGYPPKLLVWTPPSLSLKSPQFHIKSSF